MGIKYMKIFKMVEYNQSHPRILCTFNGSPITQAKAKRMREALGAFIVDTWKKQASHEDLLRILDRLTSNPLFKSYKLLYRQLKCYGLGLY